MKKALKAYKNPEFLGSPEARTIRMLAEYLEPESRLKKFNIEDTIVFFGSARIKPPADARACRDEPAAENKPGGHRARCRPGCGPNRA